MAYLSAQQKRQRAIVTSLAAGLIIVLGAVLILTRRGAAIPVGSMSSTWLSRSAVTFPSSRRGLPAAVGSRADKPASPHHGNVAGPASSLPCMQACRTISLEYASCTLRRAPAAEQQQGGMNSTQQRLAVVDRMYSGDLSENYLGSLSLLDPEVPISSSQARFYTICLPASGCSVTLGFACMHHRCAFAHVLLVMAVAVYHVGLSAFAAQTNGIPAPLPAVAIRSQICTA